MLEIVFEALEPIVHGIARALWFAFRWLLVDFIFFLGEQLLGSLFKNAVEKRTAASYVAGLVIIAAVIFGVYYLLAIIPSDPPAL